MEITYELVGPARRWLTLTAPRSTLVVKIWRL